MGPDFDALRAATMAAGNIQSPVSNLGASNAPELAALHQSSFQLPQSSAGAAAGAGVAGDIVAEQKRQAAAAEAARKLAEQKKADLSDPSKYRKQKKADGGYDFYDPDGNQIDIATLTQRTGTKAAEWVGDSENPIDIQYLEDSKNLSEYISAKLGGDKAKASKYEAERPELKDYQGKGGADKLIEEFKKYYQRYYVPSQWGERPRDGAMIPRGGGGDGEDDEFGL